MPYARESAASLRERYVAVCRENPVHGPRLFAEKFREMLGLTDEKGCTLLSESTGAPTLAKNRRLTSQSVNFRDLGEAILGEGWVRKLGLDTPGPDAPPLSYFLQEADGDSGGVGPGTLPNVTSWKTAVSGLLGARALEAYENPAYILRTLPRIEPVALPTPPTWRLHDVVPTGQPAPKFDPRKGHPASDLNSLYLQTQPMEVFGLKIEVDKLTVVHDLTGGRVMAMATENGDRIALAEELEAAYVMTAVNDSLFNLGRTNDVSPTYYTTFNSAAVVRNTKPDLTEANTTLYQNDFVNPMVDYESLVIPRNAMNQMYHPVNASLPINVISKVVLVPPHLTPAAKFALSQRVQQRNAPAGKTNTNLTEYMENPYGAMAPEGIVESRYLDVVHRAATGPVDGIKGLALTGQGLNRWYIGDPRAAFRKLVGWEMQTVQFGEQQSPYTANHLLQLSQFNNAYFKFMPTSPFHWIRCKGV